MSHRNWHTVAALLGGAVGMLSSAAAEAQQRRPLPKSVRVVYCVPTDREVRQDYRKAIEAGVVEMQQFYYRSLFGRTFLLNSPIVEIYHPTNEAQWYTDHVPEANPNAEHRFYVSENLSREIRQTLGARRNDPTYRWIFYIDCPPGWGSGAQGLCIMCDADLLGLSGRSKEDKRISRWIGGIGHEFGHALGLPHPPDGYDIHSMMDPEGGFRAYPDTYFAEADRKKLLKHPFIAERKPVAGITQAALYDGGYFVHVGKKRWEERRTDSNSVLYFNETERDDEHIVIHDATRDISVKLPVSDGNCFLSFKGEPWRKFYQIKW
ncbi:MAG TPA: hypothetical protein VFG04_11640 [Planctomycetaceae bacterium]|nr:hypothetical protein [Planctomycetaceae bacterium]